MTMLSKEEKQQVFQEELEHLRDNGYISEKEFTRLLNARSAYLTDYESVKKDPPESVSREEQEPKAELTIKKKPEKPVKKKKTKSPEQIRERNITWSLILGVSILLITGLIVATSQWEQMGAGAKVVSISLVSLFFFALSYGTGRFLKIKQTAFAFLTLGSLLIPIIIVAIGFFELFGSYLSLFGEGKYLLGLMGALLPLPLYVRHAFVHKSRLYVWISLLFLTLTVGFSLGALPISVDAFYFGLMLYNAGLLFAYIRYQKKGSIQLFTEELPLFAQLNLVLATLLMLFFFQNEVFYSFNLLLTASIYMAMVFVYKTKEYQFVFSVMLIYAVYQLVEHTPLQSLDSVIYALVGLFYIGFAYAFRNHTFIEKVFRYTSGVVSFVAFLYISYEGILMRGEASSWMLLAAYLLITINYGVLAYLTRLLVFTYMAPVFLLVSSAQLWDLIQLGPWYFFLFSAAALTLIYVGVWTKSRWFKPVKDSTFYTSTFVLIFCLYVGLAELQFGYSALMLFLIGIVAYLVQVRSEVADVKKISIWAQPVAWALSSVVLYFKLIEWLPAYEDGFSVPFHFAVSGLLLLALHFVWKKVGEGAIARTSFYVAQETYISAMVLLMADFNVDTMMVRPAILVVGIGMMYMLVSFVGHASLWGLVSVVLSGFYLSLIDPLSIETFQAVLIYVTFLPVLLITLAEWGEKKWPGLRPYFYWLGHMFLPLIIGLLMLDQLSPESIYPLILLVPLAVYIYSSITGKREAEKKGMLYAALTTGFFVVYALPRVHGLWTAVQDEYAFLFTSVLMAGLWISVPVKWKKRIDWYWVPFSILGLFFLTVEAEVTGSLEWVWTLGYVGLILIFLHKRNWSLIRFIPLFLTFDLWDKMSVLWSRPAMILTLILCIGALLIAGKYFHKRLVGITFATDVYSWTALVYIGYLSLYTTGDESVWIRILPVCFLGIWFFLGAGKWKRIIMTKSFYTATVVILYVAYLMILDEYSAALPEVMIGEMQVLPLIGVLVFLQKKTWPDYRAVMNHVHLAALLLIAGYLVVDAIQSHTIWDAWIIGGLSLASMIAGMQLRIKSYFLVGMGVLIFNIIYQTRPYWGSMPWWVYLLMAGLVLIGIASYNEWKKQQTDSEKQGEQKWKKLWVAFRKWN